MPSVEPEASEYEYAVIAASQLQQYTGDDGTWEFVELVHDKNAQLLFTHHPPPMDPHNPTMVQYGSEPQPTLSGNAVTTTTLYALVRRRRELRDLKRDLDDLRADKAAFERTHTELVNRMEAEIAEANARLKKSRELLDAKTAELTAAKQECDAAKAQLKAARKELETVELDIGKRQMDIILGRYDKPDDIDLVGGSE